MSSREIIDRFDASHYLTSARSYIKDLSRTSNPLAQLGDIVEKVYVAPRFARIYVNPEFGLPLLQGHHIPLTKICDMKYIYLKLKLER